VTASCAPSGCEASCKAHRLPGPPPCEACRDVGYRALAFAADRDGYDALVADTKARQGRRKPGAGTSEDKHAGDRWTLVGKRLRCSKGTAKPLVLVAQLHHGWGPLAEGVRPEALPDLRDAALNAINDYRTGECGAQACYDHVFAERRSYLTPEAAEQLALDEQRKASRASKDRPFSVARRAARVLANLDASILDDLSDGEAFEFRSLLARAKTACSTAIRDTALDGDDWCLTLSAADSRLDLAEYERHLAAPPTSPAPGGTGSPPTGGLLKARLGIAPTSDIGIPKDRERHWRILVGDTGETREHAVAHPSETGTVSIPSAFLTAHLTASYTEPGALVLDPFAGGPTRAVVTTHLGRRYLGVDLRPDQVQVTQARLDALDLSQRARVLTADSTTFDWRAHIDARAAASISCPPYFNLERYSDDPRDLSMAPSYGAFLDMLGGVIDGLVPALAPGAFVAWIVGEVRDPRTGQTYFLPKNVRRLFEERGLIALGTRIIERSQPPTGVGSFLATKRVLRVHEEIVVMRVPEDGLPE